MIRLLHAADLHLDSPLGVARPASVDPGLRHPALVALSRLVDVALAEQVDAVLLAGDLFDRPAHALRARLHLFRELERLVKAGCQVFAVHGNHDPRDQSVLDAPPGVHVFTDQHAEVLTRSRAGEAFRVQGISFQRPDVLENLAARFERRGPEPTVGLLHANVGSIGGHQDYAPCTVQDLQRAGMDYWALGHVHQRTSFALAGGARAEYPGNLQGRHAQEPGPRGALVVSLAPGAPVDVRFVALDAVRWHRVDVDLLGARTPADALDALKLAVLPLATQPGPRLHVARVKVVGHGDFHHVLQGDGAAELEAVLRQELPENLLVDGVEWETRPALDVAALSRRGGVAAEAVRWLGTGAPVDPDDVAGLPDVLAQLSRRGIRLPPLAQLVERGAHEALARLEDG